MDINFIHSLLLGLKFPLMNQSLLVNKTGEITKVHNNFKIFLK